MSSSSDQGSGTSWGPLFGAGAQTWAETWEGEGGWGGPAYDFVLGATQVDAGVRILDVGCGAGRFLETAARRGANVAGLDAAQEMVDSAAQRVPDADLRVGDLESLPWPDDAFDLVTGFSSFQFAADKVHALQEAARVASREVAVVVPTLGDDAGIASVFQPVFPLFPEDGLEMLKARGIFALSGEGVLDEALVGAGLEVRSEALLDCPATFQSQDEAVRAFLDAGPTRLASEHSGKEAVAAAINEGLRSFVAGNGVEVPGRFRAVITEPRSTAVTP